jgi:hypothetical protein
MIFLQILFPRFIPTPVMANIIRKYTIIDAGNRRSGIMATRIIKPIPNGISVFLISGKNGRIMLDQYKQSKHTEKTKISKKTKYSFALVFPRIKLHVRRNAGKHKPITEALHTRDSKNRENVNGIFLYVLTKKASILYKF